MKLFAKEQTVRIGSQKSFLIPRYLDEVARGVACHMHVIGVSGSGKSHFLAHLYDELARLGHGVTLVDPHGDLADLVAGRTPDVSYLDLPRARDEGKTLAFNVLDGATDQHERSVQILEAFHRAYPELDNGSPAFDTVMKNALKLIMSNDLTMGALYEVLTRPDVRATLLTREDDPDVVTFFAEYFDRLTSRDQEALAGSARRRANDLMFSPFLKESLRSPDLRVDPKTIMNAGEKLVMNLALTDSHSRLMIGSLLSVLYEQAALGRRENRKPHFLIIDEFSEFSAKSEEALSRILSQCRKYGLYLVLAHQTWSQTSKRLQGALQNVGIEIAFRLGRVDAQDEALILGRVNPEEVKHIVEEGEERSHPIFYSLPEQWEKHVQRLQDLKAREAIIRTQDGQIHEFRTLDVLPPQDARKRQIQAFARQYFNDRKHPVQRPTTVTRRGVAHRQEVS